MIFGLIHVTSAGQHDDGYMDGRSHIKVHTDERTQVHSDWSPIQVLRIEFANTFDSLSVVSFHYTHKAMFIGVLYAACISCWSAECHDSNSLLANGSRLKLVYLGVDSPKR